RLDMPELGREEIHALIYDILTDEQKAKFEATHDLDFSLELNGVGRFRINAFLHRLGEGAVLRLIPEGIKSLAELGMPPVLKDLAMQDRGLVLITGPTGSGKSTTLAAMIDHMNENREDHIITVEDPIEFVHTHKECNINRVVDVFPTHQQEQIRVQLAESLLGVVAETLVPALNGGGRVAAMEIMVSTAAIRNIIRENKIHQLPSAIQTGARDGMQSFDQSLKALVKSKKISPEEALKVAVEKQAF